MRPYSSYLFLSLSNLYCSPTGAPKRENYPKRAAPFWDKGLTEFAARKPRIKSNRFLRRRVRRKKHFARSRSVADPPLAAGQGAERSEIPLVKKSNALFDYLYSCSKNIGLIATTSSYSACSTCTEALSAFRSALSTSSASGAVCARPSRRMRIIRRRTMGWA